MIGPFADLVIGVVVGLLVGGFAVYVVEAAARVKLARELDAITRKVMAMTPKPPEGPKGPA